MKSKGALIWDYAQPWSVEEIEIGDPQYGEVKVRVETAGLCQFDQRLASGDVPTAEFPILGGHEGAGVIVEGGAGVEQLTVGIMWSSPSFPPAACASPACPAITTCVIEGRICSPAVPLPTTPSAFAHAGTMCTRPR